MVTGWRRWASLLITVLLPRSARLRDQRPGGWSRSPDMFVIIIPFCCRRSGCWRMSFSVRSLRHSFSNDTQGTASLRTKPKPCTRPETVSRLVKTPCLSSSCFSRGHLDSGPNDLDLLLFPSDCWWLRSGLNEEGASADSKLDVQSIRNASPGGEGNPFYNGLNSRY